MLVDQLKVTLADTFAFYLKAQFYHWNVEGPDFVQYHDFLGDLYEDVHGSVDGIAELIRTLNSYAPGTLSRLKELTTVAESDVIPDARTMLTNLETENLRVRASLLRAYELAEQESEFGVSNYIQDRIQAHEKHSWMLRSLLK